MILFAVLNMRIDFYVCTLARGKGNHLNKFFSITYC